MSRIFDISHRYVDEIAALDPNLATAIGVPGHERELTDYSPAGHEAIADTTSIAGRWMSSAPNLHPFVLSLSKHANASPPT